MATIEAALREERTQRKIERFFWIFAVVILGDAYLLKILDPMLPSIVLMLLSMVFLIGCAQWLDVPWVTIFLERLFSRFLSARRDHSLSGKEQGSAKN